MSQFNDFMAHIQAQGEGPDWLGYEGTIIGPTYDPVNNTVDAVLGETLADFGDDSPGYSITGTLESTQVGDQSGPQGGERCIIFPTAGGFRILIHSGFDDSPGAKQGERWILHAKQGTLGAGNQPVWDTGLKLKNDGATHGDGLGGAELGYHGALTASVTSGGFVDKLDDTAHAATTQTPGGMSRVMDDTNQTIKHSALAPGTGQLFSLLDAVAQQITHRASAPVDNDVYALIDGAAQQIIHQAAPSVGGGNRVATIIDGAGNTISHVVKGISGGVVSLGDTATALSGAGFAAFNHSGITALGGNVDSAALANLRAFATALGTSGIATGGQVAALLGIVVSSWLSNTVIPPGSAIVRIAS